MKRARCPECRVLIGLREDGRFQAHGDIYGACPGSNRSPFDTHQYKTGLPSVPGDTSEAAAESMKPSVGNLRAQVYDFIASQSDGATCDQCEQALGLRHQTASARVRELVKADLVADSGERRKTSSKRTARVYRAKGNG